MGAESSAIEGSGVVNACHDTVVIADGDKKIILHMYLNELRTNTEARNTRIDGQTEYLSTDTARYALGWHVMALHCTVLRARELFVLRMRTLAIQYPDPWGKSAIPNKENSPPCPGWGEVGANIDRCITPPWSVHTVVLVSKYVCWICFIYIT